MYQKLEQTDYAVQMGKINQALCDLFEYLADEKEITEESLKPFLQWEIGEQFSKGLLFEAILAIAEETHSQRILAYRALLHDLQFVSHIGDGTFCFEEKNLSCSMTKKISDFMNILYKSRFQSSAVRLNGEKFRYRELKDACYEKNKKLICPVCLGHESFSRSGELDHYLPKSKYPLLAFHPDNLALTCHTCNSVEKKAKDPLQQRKMTEVYFPYHRAAEEETEIAVGGRAGHKRLSLWPVNEDPAIAGRLESLDELYALRERWAGLLPAFLQSLMNVILDLGLNREQAKQFLDWKVKATEKEALRAPHMRLEAACCRYFSSEGRQEFLAEWERRRRERDALQNK